MLAITQSKISWAKGNKYRKSLKVVGMWVAWHVFVMYVNIIVLMRYTSERPQKGLAYVLYFVNEEPSHPKNSAEKDNFKAIV